MHVEILVVVHDIPLDDSGGKDTGLQDVLHDLLDLVLERMLHVDGDT